MDEATRPILWNISHGWLIYVLFPVSLAIAAWGIGARVRRWRSGMPTAEEVRASLRAPAPPRDAR